MITGSEYACSMGGTQIWLEPGEQLTLDEMLKAIAVGSANDCAVAVAEHLAGTEAAFVERMNTRARELGCTNTTFINANGLDGEGQKTLTSARDLALISCELLRHPKILEYTGIWMDTVRGGKFGLANTNKMLKSYQGLTGLKTGYIREAGFCISASAERDGLSLVAVVLAALERLHRQQHGHDLCHRRRLQLLVGVIDVKLLPVCRIQCRRFRVERAHFGQRRRLHRKHTAE